MPSEGRIDPSTYESRQARLMSQVSEGRVVLASRGSDIRWLTGFSGSQALVVLVPGGSVLLTDGRYEEQASREAAVDSIRIVRGELVGAVPEALAGAGFDTGAGAGMGGGAGTVHFQADDLTFERVMSLQSALGAGLTADVSLEPLGDLLSELRSSKDADELGFIQGALALSERVMSAIPEVLRAGVTEREVAAEIDYRHRMAGADGPAFDTIVAFGERAALPHARPGGARLKRGDCILLDFGCVVNGYRSDITRTFVFGDAPDEFEEVYRAVGRALRAAQDAVVPDLDGKELDAVARRSLESDGLAEYFVHSLGHGVGLDIHEAPRVSPVTSSRIQRGAVITIEPGVYLPGRFGIRLENMVCVEDSGARVLNELDTGLTIL